MSLHSNSLDPTLSEPGVLTLICTVHGAESSNGLDVPGVERTRWDIYCIYRTWNEDFQAVLAMYRQALSIPLSWQIINSYAIIKTGVTVSTNTSMKVVSYGYVGVGNLLA